MPQASRRAVSRPHSRPARVSLSLSLRCPRSRPAHRTAPHLAQVRTWPLPASHWGRAHHRSIEVGVLLVTVVPQLVETLEFQCSGGFRWHALQRVHLAKRRRRRRRRRGGGGQRAGQRTARSRKRFPKDFFQHFLEKNFRNFVRFYPRGYGVGEKYSEISQVVPHPPAVGRSMATA